MVLRVAVLEGSGSSTGGAGWVLGLVVRMLSSHKGQPGFDSSLLLPISVSLLMQALGGKADDLSCWVGGP